MPGCAGARRFKLRIEGKEDSMRRILQTMLRFSGPGAFGFLALLFALVAADPALAGKCVYSDGTSNDGPCMEVRNTLDWAVGRELNLWCLFGPTAESHKIVLGPGDSFTCKGKRVKIYRDPCDPCLVRSLQSCGDGKTILKLERRAIGFRTFETYVKSCG